MTQKLHIKTWDCQMNEYDSSKMADLLLNTHGLELTDIPRRSPDVLLQLLFYPLKKSTRKSVPSARSLENYKNKIQN